MKVVQRASWKQWLLTFGIFSLICFVVLYFNVFHPLLQIAISLSGVYAFLLIGQRSRKKNEATGLSYYRNWDAVDAWFWPIYAEYCMNSKRGCGKQVCLQPVRYSGLHLALVLAFLCFILAVGLLLFLFMPGYFQITRNRLIGMKSSFTGFRSAFVFGWSSWFFHRWSRQAAAVLFVAGSLIWFMPELYAAVLQCTSMAAGSAYH